jgi:hypothetical protein
MGAGGPGWERRFIDTDEGATHAPQARISQP